jgi:hypothetical protein
MLLDIIADTIAPQPDMDIVDGGPGGTSLLETAENTDADVVILARDAGAASGNYDELLHGRPRLRVIELLEAGRYGSLHEMEPHHRPLGELSPRHLVDVIRGSAGAAARAGS